MYRSKDEETPQLDLVEYPPVKSLKDYQPVF